MSNMPARWLRRIVYATVLATLAIPAVAATDIGKTVIVVKTVLGTLETRVRQLVLNDNVAQNEIIATEADAASEIQFVDGTKLSVGPNARITLNKFVYDPSPTRGAFFLTAVSGVFRFVTGNMDHQSYSITTPNGTIGVRGTSIVFTVYSDHTTLNTLFGDAFIIDKNGSEFPIHQGQTHTVWQPGTHGDDNAALTGFQGQVAQLDNLIQIGQLAGLSPTAGGGPGPTTNFAPSLGTPGAGNPPTSPSR
jgi:hypothetical protein